MKGARPSGGPQPRTAAIRPSEGSTLTRFGRPKHQLNVPPGTPRNRSATHDHPAPPLPPAQPPAAAARRQSRGVPAPCSPGGAPPSISLRGPRAGGGGNARRPKRPTCGPSGRGAGSRVSGRRAVGARTRVERRRALGGARAAPWRRSLTRSERAGERLARASPHAGGGVSRAPARGQESVPRDTG